MKTTIIGIAGGSGSGKSTFTNRLKNFFGENITVIYHDNYYRANDKLSMEERRKIGVIERGQSAWTPAFNLKKHGVKYIIHTVGIRWQDGNQGGGNDGIQRDTA